MRSESLVDRSVCLGVERAPRKSGVASETYSELSIILPLARSTGSGRTEAHSALQYGRSTFAGASAKATALAIAHMFWYVDGSF